MQCLMLINYLQGCFLFTNIDSDSRLLTLLENIGQDCKKLTAPNTLSYISCVFFAVITEMRFQKNIRR
jgi:hypothetical protein